jgi:2-C-methyl-D-erythritol 4-phosphate cytidylyltransferase
MEDALKEVTDEGEVVGGVPRRGKWRAQTPQVFERAALEESLSKADAQGRVCEDCSEMLVRAGYRVRVIAGDASNIKVTTTADLNLAEKLLAARAR